VVEKFHLLLFKAFFACSIFRHCSSPKCWRNTCLHVAPTSLLFFLFEKFLPKFVCFTSRMFIFCCLRGAKLFLQNLYHSINITFSHMLIIFPKHSQSALSHAFISSQKQMLKYFYLSFC
jgi:hypothetical protein